MLVIRDAQIQSFIAGNDNDLLQIICDAVTRADRERVSEISPVRLESMAKIGIERAKNTGFTKAEDIAAFVALMFEISPNFHSQPAIAAVLTDGNYLPGERLIQLTERVTEEAWAEAEAGYDAGLWFSEGE